LILLSNSSWIGLMAMKKDLRVLQVNEMLHGAVGVAQWEGQNITGGSKSQSPIGKHAAS